MSAPRLTAHRQLDTSGATDNNVTSFCALFEDLCRGSHRCGDGGRPYLARIRWRKDRLGQPAAEEEEQEVGRTRPVARTFHYCCYWADRQPVRASISHTCSHRAAWHANSGEPVSNATRRSRAFRDAQQLFAVSLGGRVKLLDIEAPSQDQEDQENLLEISAWTASTAKVAKVNACDFAEGRLVVGGVTSDGKGAIELWQSLPPIVTHNPLDPGTGA